MGDKRQSSEGVTRRGSALTKNRPNWRVEIWLPLCNPLHNPSPFGCQAVSLRSSRVIKEQALPDGAEAALRPISLSFHAPIQQDVASSVVFIRLGLDAKWHPRRPSPLRCRVGIPGSFGAGHSKGRIRRMRDWTATM